jgi:uncharacterized membrane protein YeaQ/YmgE (transglycosylase-associated protein family)
MPAGMRRTLTVGVPALAAGALLLAAAIEIAFLQSAAAGYCPEYGGILDFCLFPPSEDAGITIWLALGLAGAAAGSCVFAWRRILGKAAAFASPGLIGTVVGSAVAVSNNTGSNPFPVINTPPPGYWLVDAGHIAALVGTILLGVACVVQLVVRRLVRGDAVARSNQP